MTAQFSATCKSFDCCSFSAAAYSPARISTRLDTAIVAVSIFVAVIVSIQVLACMT